MRAFLWGVTILGLLPLIAVSVLQLASIVSLRRVTPAILAEHREADDDEDPIIITQSTLQFEGARYPIVISSNAWPAAIALGGVTLCFIGLFFLFPRQPIYADENGFDRVTPLVERLMASNAGDRSLVIATQDDEQSLLVSGHDGEWTLGLVIESQQVERIEKIKEQFAVHGVEPLREHVTHDDAFDASYTLLDYPLTGNAAVDAATCVEVFREGLGVRETEPMRFECDW